MSATAGAAAPRRRRVVTDVAQRRAEILDASVKVFNLLFSGSSTMPDPGATDPGTTDPGTTTGISRAKRRKSILDFVKADTDSLLKKLGARDKEKMDQYFTSITELEGKARTSAGSRPFAGTPSGRSIVAARLCGASRSALGENTRT